LVQVRRQASSQSKALETSARRFRFNLSAVTRRSVLPKELCSLFCPSNNRTQTRAKAGAGSEMFDSLWKYSAKDIDGEDQSLSKFEGKVGLVVNVATI
jgi:hypothetical protein